MTEPTTPRQKRRARKTRQTEAALARHAAAEAIDCPKHGCLAAAGVWCGYDNLLGPWMHDMRYEASAPVEGPRFQHDHDNCTFLGRFTADKKKADLYYCPQGGIPTVIARFSSDGPDYTSGLPLADSDPHLREARRRAFDLGLVPEIADLLDRGYVHAHESPDHNVRTSLVERGRVVGARVCNEGQRYPEARERGTATVMAVVHKVKSSWENSYGRPDIEIVVAPDDTSLGLFRTWADYGTVVARQQ